MLLLSVPFVMDAMAKSEAASELPEAFHRQAASIKSFQVPLALRLGVFSTLADLHSII